jgi:hypothetical protein
MSDQPQSRATLLLFFLFFLGFAVTLAALIDLHWTHWILVRETAVARVRQELR